MLDLFPRARKAEHGGVELGKVVFENGGGVACGITGDDEGEERRALACGRGG